jgi:hypothetical protein
MNMKVITDLMESDDLSNREEYLMVMIKTLF